MESSKLNLVVKNGLFILICVGSVGLLSIYLTSASELSTPKSWKPESDRAKNVAAIIETIDESFEDQWSDCGLEVAQVADDLLVARRLSLGLSGTIPSVQELKILEQQPSDQRISWWGSRLLEDTRTHDYLAERLARAWVGVEEGPFLVYRRRRFVSWLSNQLAKNRRYNFLVKDLMTDEGIWTDSPAVNFYTRNIIPDSGTDDKPDPILLTGRTVRAFVGMRIDCLQCHDDFLDNIYVGDPDGPRNGEQTDFHQLAAFFGGTRNSFFGINDISNDKASWKYQLLHDDEETEIEPAVPWQPELLPEDLPLRKQLAHWVTHRENRPFSRAIVNRMWAVMAGRPMMEPVDNIPLDGPFPEAMEILVDDFIEHEFDLRRLIRLIANTKAYRLESFAEHDLSTQHQEALAVFPMSRLRPDQMAGAISQAASLRPIDQHAHIFNQLRKYGEVVQFVSRYGDPGENEFEQSGETVTQKLLMFNGEMVNTRISDGSFSSSHIAGLSPDIETTIETVFLATLSRRPTQDEYEYFQQNFEDDEQNKEAVIQLYWSLINSLEFGWNH
jgi:hypothetical protein